MKGSAVVLCKIIFEIRNVLQDHNKILKQGFKEVYTQRFIEGNIGRLKLSNLNPLGKSFLAEAP